MQSMVQGFRREFQMQYELTVKGTAAELAQFLSIAESLGLQSQNDEAEAIPISDTSQSLAEFVSGLSREGRYLLNIIASNSPPHGDGVTDENLRDTLRDIRGMWGTGDPDNVELVQVYGVIGGIARRWSSIFPDQSSNPFRKQQVGPLDVYILNRQLAGSLRQALGDEDE